MKALTWTAAILATSFILAQPVRAQVSESTARAGNATPHGALAPDLDCSACHGAEGWKVRPHEVELDHDKSGFPLTGRHSQASCSACHLSLRFDGPKIAVDDCASCHADLHQGSLGLECVACHDTESFEARSDPDVHARTSFPLTGAHLLVHCESCHLDDRRARFDALDTECNSCHERDFIAARDHVLEDYSLDCLECHNGVAWFNQAKLPPPDGR